MLLGFEHESQESRGANWYSRLTQKLGSTFLLDLLRSHIFSPLKWEMDIKAISFKTFLLWDNYTGVLNWGSLCGTEKYSLALMRVPLSSTQTPSVQHIGSHTSTTPFQQPKSLSSAPKSVSSTRKPLGSTPSVPHQKPLSSTNPLVPHLKPLNSTPKPPQLRTENPSVPNQEFLSSTQWGDWHGVWNWGVCWTEGFWCWTEGFLVWNWCVELRGVWNWVGPHLTA